VSVVGRKSIFAGALRVMLSDGYLSVDEKRLILKLAALIGLDEQTPLAIYDAVMSGEEIEEGEMLSPKEQLNLYSEILMAVLTDDKISEDEMNVVKYIAGALSITEAVGRAMLEKVKLQLSNPLSTQRTDFLSNLLSDVGRITSDLFGVLKKGQENNTEANDN